MSIDKMTTTNNNDNNANNNATKKNGDLLLLPKVLLPTEMDDFLLSIPKVELHIHIEGTLEPNLVFELANRNGIELPFSSSEELSHAYNFPNLQSFLDLYYQSCAVLIKQQDFYDMTMSYLTRAHEQNVCHVELFVDPQSHTSRGINVDIVLDGIIAALQDGKSKFGISYKIIVCILRHLEEDSAIQMLDEVIEYNQRRYNTKNSTTTSLSPIVGLGLDSSEIGNPPSKFINVFEKARNYGLKVCSHAGEEGPPSYITDSLDLLQVDRIDHGLRCLEDTKLVERLKTQQIPLTVCPHSNVMLRVFDTMADHNIQMLLQRGLNASIHSDDPAYFGGYLLDNYRSVVFALSLSEFEIIQLSRNAINSSFLNDIEKTSLHHRLDDSIQLFKNNKNKILPN